MKDTAVRHLEIIHAFSFRWKEEIQSQIDSGTNFLVILPDGSEGLQEMCELLEMSPECAPHSLPRYTLFSLSQYMEPKEFDFIMLAQESGHRILFVDQLDLALNQPPRTKPYLVYCAIWGFLSQHEHLSEAEKALDDYEKSVFGFRANPDAFIYHWTNEKWEILETQ